MYNISSAIHHCCRRLDFADGISAIVGGIVRASIDRVFIRFNTYNRKACQTFWREFYPSRGGQCKIQSGSWSPTTIR